MLAALLPATLLLTRLVLVQLNGTPALLIVPVLVHPLLFLMHGADSLLVEWSLLYPKRAKPEPANQLTVVISPEPRPPPRRRPDLSRRPRARDHVEPTDRRSSPA